MTSKLHNELLWEKLLSKVRRKDLAGTNPSSVNAGGDRTETERDYDRVLFSTPVRRLADKTQVFPLERNDSVRNRLTHSHEVSNIARSIGIAITHRDNSPFNKEIYRRNIPAMLATVGLAHDIGNPPFGHQGEQAISTWFANNSDKAFSLDGWSDDMDAEILKQMKSDYLNFEGNAQALRILTKLQIMNDNFGLNLTCGSLAALMKYPTTSNKTNKKNVSLKKFGCFHSEYQIAQEVWEQTGLGEGKRHPLAFLMEASDDIAYSVMDVEDAVKKCLISYGDVIAHLNRFCAEAEKDGAPEAATKLLRTVIEKSEGQHNKHKESGLSSREVNDLSMQMFRVFAVGDMVSAVISVFLLLLPDLEDGTVVDDLIKASDADLLCDALKNCASANAYRHRSVLELELNGYKVIQSTMDMLWPAIVSRGDPKTNKKHTGTPFEKYAYGRISENYRRVFEDPENALPLGYKRCQLLADMISGMTDSFALSFEAELRGLHC